MKKPRQVRVGDLFSGAGLFSEAFRASGARPSFAVEIDPLAAASYARNVGDHIRVGSVLTVSPQKVDIIIAGPPCQGFSTLGRRDPKDVRNQLCLVIPVWAKACRAEVVVIENVPQFLKSHYWHEMAGAFESGGFDVTTWTLNASDFSVPQRRSRSFTIASKRGIPDLPLAMRGEAAKIAFRRVRKGDPMHVWPEGSGLATARMRSVPPLGDRRNIVERAPELCPPSWFRIGCQATDVWGRIDPSLPSNTLRCDFQNPSKGRYLHPHLDRVISLREGARLQQISDEWEFAGHRTAITRQIGNGVPIGLGRAVADRVLSLF